MGSYFTAQSVPSSRSRARYRFPCPPFPNCSIIKYRSFKIIPDISMITTPFYAFTRNAIIFRKLIYYLGFICCRNATDQIRMYRNYSTLCSNVPYFFILFFINIILAVPHCIRRPAWQKLPQKRELSVYIYEIVTFFAQAIASAPSPIWHATLNDSGSI